MFTQIEKNFLLMVLNSVTPQAKDRIALRAMLDVHDSVVHKVEAMPVEPVESALPPELIKAVGQETRTARRKRK